MFILGVTGSIGSGKSFFCKCLKKHSGVRVISSDDEVHDLYEKDEILFQKISENFAQAIINNKIDRVILGEIVFSDLNKKKNLENIVYPILKLRRENNIKKAKLDGVDILVLDIPLLFENNLQTICNSTLTVYCDPEIQKDRVLRRGGMNEDKFNKIMALQMPVEEKISLSDYSFNSDGNKVLAEEYAAKLYNKLINKLNN